MKLATLLPFALIGAITVPPVLAQGHDHDQDAPAKQAPAKDKEKAPAAEGKEDQKVMRVQRPSYPLTTCPISGKPLGDAPVEKVVKGRLVRFCCGKCAAKVEVDPSAAFQKIDDAVIAAQKTSYPLKTSPISDAKLDDKAIDYVYGTRLVRLASKDEIEKFQKDPKAAMEKVNKAYIDAQLASYPLKKCPVSEEPLGADKTEPVNYLYWTKLVRFCCKDCIKDFEKEPDKFLKELGKAQEKAPEKAPGKEKKG